MPSSELSRIHLWSWACEASRLESLLLGMHEACVKAAEKLVHKFGKATGFYTLTTAGSDSRYNNGPFVHKLNTCSGHLDSLCAHVKAWFLIRNLGFYTHRPQDLQVLLTINKRVIV